MSKPCVIFDFDGVIADTESLHLAAYNHALKILAPQIGRELQIAAREYFSNYIVYGNFEAFRNMLHDAGLSPTTGLIEKLCEEKDRIMDAHLGELAAPLPGVKRLLDHLKETRIPCGICSGARRAEITTLLRAFGILERFAEIVTIEDVRMCKPDPEGYALAFEKLWRHFDAEIEKEFSLVIEDTAGGAAAAHGAGLRVLGVAAGRDQNSIRAWADYVVEDLSQLDLAEFDRWLSVR